MWFNLFKALSSPTFQAFFNNPFFLVPKKSFLGRFFCPEKNGFVFKRLSFSVWASHTNFIKLTHYLIPENSCHSYKITYFCTTN